MLDVVKGLSPVVQVLLATGFTWGMTALGAALVFLTKEVKRWVLDAMLGFAAGVISRRVTSRSSRRRSSSRRPGGLPRGYRRWSGSWAGGSSCAG